MSVIAINVPQWLLYGLGTLSAFAALRILWRRPGSLRALIWAIGWMSLAAVSTLTLLAAADFGRYQSIVPGAVIATVNIDQQTRDPGMTDRTPDGYRVHIVTRGGVERDVDVGGNHWILDIQTIRCGLPLCPVFLYRNRHFYAARAQSGAALPRYETVEIGDLEGLLDVWSWMARLPRLRGLILVGEAATTSIPVRNGASYEIRIDAEGRLSVADSGH
ncbi:MAG: hypothetical protein WBN82_03575 [Porticoccaceae bacterium]